MDYPKILTASDWDKKKGLLAKSHSTGIGDALKALERMHKAVDWGRYDADAWAKASTVAEDFDQLAGERLKEFQAKVSPIAGHAESVVTLADKWAGKFAKDKLVPKSAAQAAQGVGAAAAELADGIKRFPQKAQAAAKLLRGKLPSGASGEGDADSEDKLFDLKLLKGMLGRLKRDAELSANFAFAPAAKDRPPILLVSLKVSGKKLLDKIREEKDVSTGAFGTARVDDKKLLLTVEKKASGIVKGARAAALAAGERFSTVVLVGEGGQTLESDEEGSGESQVDPGAKLGASVQPESPRADEPTEKPTDEPTDEPTERAPEPVRSQVYAGRRAGLAERLKEALLLSAHTGHIKGLYEAAERLDIAGEEREALAALDTLEQALGAIATQRELFEKVVSTVQPALENLLKTASPANRKRLAARLEPVTTAKKAGNFAGARTAMIELGKLIAAIHKESTPAAGPSGDEGDASPGEFLRDMNEEGDWNLQAATLKELTDKVGELKNWKDPGHGELQAALTKIDEAVQARNFTLAGERLEALAPKVRKLHAQHPERGQWFALATAVAGAPGRVEALNTEGAPEVPSLRYELHFAAQQGEREKYKDALEKFDAFDKRLKKLEADYQDPDRKRWALMNGVLLSVSSKIESAEGHLDALGVSSSQPGTLTNELDAVKLLQKTQPGQACTDLANLKVKADDLEKKASALGDYAVFLQQRDGFFDAADGIAKGGKPASQVAEYKNAAAALKAAGMKLSTALQVKGLLDAKIKAAADLELAYKALQPAPTGGDADMVAYRLYENSEQRAMADRLARLEWFTAALRTQHEAYTQVIKEAKTHAKNLRWADALASAKDATTKGGLLIKAHAEAGRAAKSFHARYGKIKGPVEGLRKKLLAVSSPSKEEKAFLDAVAAIELEEAKPNASYQQCIKLLSTQVEPGLKALLALRKAALHNEVESAKTPTDAGNLIDGKEPWELEVMDPKDTASLLTTLRKDWGTTAPSKAKKDRQKKVYLATKMAEDFLAHEAERRNELVNAFKGDAELKKAAKDWATTAWEDRRKLLQRVANQQCKAFGFEPVPVIQLVDIGGSGAMVTNGYFDPGTKTIVINVNPASSANDFERAVDLIVHENSHYYQDQLCTGLIDPDKRDKRLEGQIALFSANDGPGGYVSGGGDDFLAYQRQPLEDHAHMAGPKTASGILALLQDEEEDDLDLSGVLKL